MRIIDYYNRAAAYLFVLLAAAGLFLYLKKRKKEEKAEAVPAPDYDARRIRISSILVLAFGSFLRLYRLGGIPFGLQQDEASIGYEAYCLAAYGIDRNGYHWPVYPITWGSGGGSPLMIYLNVLTTKLLGPGVFSIRIVPAVLGCLTLVLFWLLLKQIWGERTALLGAIVLSLSPWHIMLSRWSLDSNTMPFWEVLSLLAFTAAVREKGNQRKRTLLYMLAAAVSALELYAYGSATLIVPVFLLLSCLVLIKSGDLTVKQFLLGIAAALVVLLPLAYFYGVNYLGLPEVSLSWISFPRFTSDHTGSVFIPIGERTPARILRNVYGLFLLLSTGLPGEVIWNQMPGYGALYSFTFPVTLLGFGEMLVRFVTGRKREADGKGDDRVLFVLLAVSLCFTLLIEQDMNRSVMLWLMAAYGFAMGLRFLYEQSKLLGRAALILMLVGFLSFGKDYYFGTYNALARVDFMSGYGEAVETAYALHSEAGRENGKIRSTYEEVASPFMLALYYTRYSPYGFQESAVYRDSAAEFRVAVEFGPFVFGLPENWREQMAPEDVYILADYEGNDLGPEWQKKACGNYVVVWTDNEQPQAVR